ncbi:unnamed protein product [Amoebophrya sp. A25]|nr:unnamed protein product [Amoebophrya sp. A25]|eukprot:GSA25T00025698001.1
MAGDEILIRLTTGAGRTRFAVPATATLKDLKEKIEAQTSVPWTQQQLCFEGNKPVPNTHGSRIAEMGMRNGTMLFLSNSKNAEIKATVSNKENLLAKNDAASRPMSSASTVVEAGGSSGAQQPSSSSGGATSSSSSSAPVAAAPKGNPGLVGGYGTTSGKEVPASALAAITGSSTAGGSSSSSASPKKPVESTGILVNGKPMELAKKNDPTHVSFEKFLQQRRFETGSLPGMQRYLPVKIVRGKQNKLPTPITLAHQKFRHVDYLEYMNEAEIQNFVGHWRSKDMMEQRGGYMYGYYRPDKHVELGVRAVMEAIYEPPQSEQDHVTFSNLPDDGTKIADQVAERLGLEKIGWIYTALPKDELLNSQEVLEIAKLQQKYRTSAHYSGYECSTFVTCTVRPDPENGGNPDTKVFQCSDQASAMLRDECLDLDNPDPKSIRIRKGGDGEVMPAVLQSGKDAGTFDPDWFIVRVNDGVPRKRKKSIFAHSKFPVENRGPGSKQQNRQALRDYMRTVKTGPGPNWARFADFHLLVWLAHEFDLETVYQLCDSIRDRKDVLPGIIEMVESV